MDERRKGATEIANPDETDDADRTVDTDEKYKLRTWSCNPNDCTFRPESEQE